MLRPAWMLALAVSAGEALGVRPALPGRGPKGYSIAGRAALGNVVQGYNTGVIAGALLLIIPEFGLHAHPGTTGLIASSTTVGAFGGTLGSAAFCDAFGRRRTMLAAGALAVAGGGIMAWSPSVRVLLLGRLIGGLATGLVSAAVPTYIAETSAATNRGALSMAPQIGVSSGIMLSCAEIFAEIFAKIFAEI